MSLRSGRGSRENGWWVGLLSALLPPPPLFFQNVHVCTNRREINSMALWVKKPCFLCTPLERFSACV